MQPPAELPPPDERPDGGSSFPHFPELVRLTDRQRTAVVLLVMGERIGKVAEKIGVARATVWRWRQNPDFRRALDKTRELAFGDSINRISALAPRAVDRLAHHIGRGHASAAFGLLRLLRVDRHF